MGIQKRQKNVHLKQQGSQNLPKGNDIAVLEDWERLDSVLPDTVVWHWGRAQDGIQVGKTRKLSRLHNLESAFKLRLNHLHLVLRGIIFFHLLSKIEVRTGKRAESHCSCSAPIKMIAKDNSAKVVVNAAKTN